MDFRLTFNRLDYLPTYRNWGPMSTLRAFLGTFKRLDDLPTYSSGGPLWVDWGPMSTLRAFLGTFKRLDDLPTYRSGRTHWGRLGRYGGRPGSDVNPPRFSGDLQTARLFAYLSQLGAHWGLTGVLWGGMTIRHRLPKEQNA